MTSEEIYAEYNAFVTRQLENGVYDTIPHCDSRILHRPPSEVETGRICCEYCDRPEWQVRRGELHIAWTGEEPEEGQIPCQADLLRPPEGKSDHRRWGGNKPTSATGDEWPEETFASLVMYGDPGERRWEKHDTPRYN